MEIDAKSFFSPEIRSKFASLYLSSGALLAPIPSTVDQSDVSLQLVISSTNVVGTAEKSFKTPLMREASVFLGRDAFNSGIKIERRKQSTTSYRGLLVNKEHPAFDASLKIIENCRKMCLNTFNEEDMSDNVWLPNTEALFQLAGTNDINEIKETAKSVISAGNKIKEFGLELYNDPKERHRLVNNYILSMEHLKKTAVDYYMIEFNLN